MTTSTEELHYLDEDDEDYADDYIDGSGAFGAFSTVRPKREMTESPDYEGLPEEDNNFVSLIVDKEEVAEEYYDNVEGTGETPTSPRSSHKEATSTEPLPTGTTAETMMTTSDEGRTTIMTTVRSVLDTVATTVWTTVIETTEEGKTTLDSSLSITEADLHTTQPTILETTTGHEEDTKDVYIEEALEEISGSSEYNDDGESSEYYDDGESSEYDHSEGSSAHYSTTEQTTDGSTITTTMANVEETPSGEEESESSWGFGGWGRRRRRKRSPSDDIYDILALDDSESDDIYDILSLDDDDSGN